MLPMSGRASTEVQTGFDIHSRSYRALRPGASQPDETVVHSVDT
jgi:hypothetical protein